MQTQSDHAKADDPDGAVDDLRELLVAESFEDPKHRWKAGSGYCELDDSDEAGGEQKDSLVARALPTCALIAVACAGLGVLVVLASRPATPFWHVRSASRDADICNPRIAPLDVTLTAKGTAAPAFAQPLGWASKCTRMEPPPAMTSTPRWANQDACWAWVKKIGCYETNSANDWWKAQEMAAEQGKAPRPDEYFMEAVRSPDKCMHVSHGAPLADANETERLQAIEWLNKHVAVYVVNLKTDVERLDTMAGRLNQLGVRWARIPGVDLRGEGALQAAVKAGFVPADFDFDYAQQVAYTDYQGMGGILGTVGCAAAHLNAMKVVAGNYKLAPQKSLALILEDDVSLADDFAAKLRRLLTTEAPCDWAAISLRSRCPYGECVSEHLTRVLPDGNEPKDRCRHGVNYGFFGMLYQLSELPALRAHLASRVWDAGAPRCLDVDVALASISDRVAYYAVPFMQEPGFLIEGGHGSARWETNVNNPTTVTTTTKVATTSTSLKAMEN